MKQSSAILKGGEDMDVDSGSGATKIHICNNIKTDISSTRVFILLSFKSRI